MSRINYMDKVLAALPATPSEIVKTCGISNTTTLKWLRLLHECKWIRIAKWRRHPRAGAPMPVYDIGCGKDVPCELKHMTKRETRLRYEAKAKQEGRYDAVRAKWRNRYWRKKAASAPNTWFGALMVTP